MTQTKCLLHGVLALLLTLTISGAPLHINTASAQVETDTVPQMLTSGWAVQVTAGWRHTCAVTSAGGVRCWGANDYGQLGDGTTLRRLSPVDVVGLTRGVVAISAGELHTCALTEDGEMLCWGNNREGQLGNGTTTGRVTPGRVIGLPGKVQAISTGDDFTCAVTEGGAAQCWGLNDAGQLGDGTRTTRLTPVPVSGLAAGVQTVSARRFHTCAVTMDSAVHCWGDNEKGQLGDGSLIDRLRPVAVLGLSGPVTKVSLGFFHTCALISGGGVECWGANLYGQLGNGSTTFREPTPGPVAGLAGGVTALSAGWVHTCAVTATGGVKCWGGNEYGRLGDGTTIDRATPVDVTGLAAGVVDLDAGEAHTCAVTSAGESWCWGDNEFGQLGDWSLTNRATPVMVRAPQYDCGAVTQIPIIECSALVTFFVNTNGPAWSDNTNWLRTDTPCDWRGVTCEAGQVTQLNLAGNNLVGILPPDLSNLRALQRLDVGGNALAGTLPAALTDLAALRALDLHSNSFSGTLPPTLGNLHALQTLDLHDNALAGPLREQLGALSSLEYLDLSGNRLEGGIPIAWSGLTGLQHLDLNHNRLADDTGGYYFDALTPLHNLRHLDLSYNGFTGGLDLLDPWQGLAGLQYLDLSHNNFAGSLPTLLAGMQHLQYLAMHTNHLSGPIPAGWASIGADVAITSTGTLPPAGVYIDVSGNHLSGTIPAALGENPALKGLQLAGNALSGMAPDAILGHPFYRLDLSYNRLEFSDPVWAREVFPTQTVPPTQLQAAEIPEGVLLTWHRIPYDEESPTMTGESGFYEISYGPTEFGPFVVHGRTPNKTHDRYTVDGLTPGATYYFRVRTFSSAHVQYLQTQKWDVFDHPYVQPNDLWSDYTPVVCVNCQVTPASSRAFLPILLR